MKIFTHYLKPFLVSALTFVLSVPLFSVAADISWSVIHEIARLILIEQLLGSNSDFLFGLVRVSIFVSFILVLYKIFLKVPNIFAESENNVEILKGIVASVGFITLLGFTYPFMIESLFITVDLLF